MFICSCEEVLRLGREDTEKFVRETAREKRVIDDVDETGRERDGRNN